MTLIQAQHRGPSAACSLCKKDTPIVDLFFCATKGEWAHSDLEDCKRCRL